MASAATTTALIGGAAVAGCLGKSHYADLVGDEEPEVLTAKEFAVLMVFAERVIAPAAGTPTARDARLARRIDRELAFSDGRLTADVRAALAMIEHAPLLDLSFRRFTRLGPAEQDAFLERCITSGWELRRSAFNGLRFLCVFFYYTDDRTWRSIGYGGPMVVRKLPEASSALEALDRPVGGGRV